VLSAYNSNSIMDDKDKQKEIEKEEERKKTAPPRHYNKIHATLILVLSIASFGLGIASCATPYYFTTEGSLTTSFYFRKVHQYDTQHHINTVTSWKDTQGWWHDSLFRSLMQVYEAFVIMGLFFIFCCVLMLLSWFLSAEGAEREKAAGVTHSSLNFSLAFLIVPGVMVLTNNSWAISDDLGYECYDICHKYAGHEGDKSWGPGLSWWLYIGMIGASFISFCISFSTNKVKILEETRPLNA